ncbi:MAG: ABC transporter substrate-binding protein [Acidimicrobiales bacterium]
MALRLRLPTVVAMAAVALLAVALNPVAIPGAAAAGTVSQRGVRTGPNGGSQRAGGSLTVLLGGTQGAWQGWDPATAPNWEPLTWGAEEVYGGLFQRNPNGNLVGDLATGYKYNGTATSLTITLRHGVTFSDGTPLNAGAVEDNLQRLFYTPGQTCGCSTDFPLEQPLNAGVTLPDGPTGFTVVLHLSRPDVAMINAFPGEEPNTVPSPTALAKMGEKAFAQHPVGAGPFEMVTNIPNVKVVLEKNPNYWQKGRPYLNKLTFLTVANDASALAALEAGQAQVYTGGYSEYLQIPSIVSLLNVYKQAGLSANQFSMNADTPPTNQLWAREALAYATNPQALNKGLWGGLGVPNQSPTDLGGLFYEPKVPGTLTYNLAKAKQLVKEHGGLTVIYPINASNSGADLLQEALAAQWKKAGINAILKPDDFTTWLSTIKSGSWNVTDQLCGAYDPGTSLGLTLCFGPNGPISGVKHDPHLDQLMNNATAIVNPAKRAKAYRNIFHYIGQQVYLLGLAASPAYLLTTKNVKFPKNAPGLLVPDALLQYFQNVTVR